MENKYKTTIYPFDRDSVFFLRHNNLCSEYHFVHIVTLSGWGLSGKDASETDDGPVIGIKIEEDFENALMDCDTVLFVEPDTTIDIHQIIYSKLIKAANEQKNIICAFPLKENEKKNIACLCKQKNKMFRYLMDEQKKYSLLSKERIEEIITPVIFVGGIAERTNKYEIQLSLRENIIKAGYKVAQVGTHNDCELMGFHSFPQFMFQKEFYEWEKISLFNHFIKSIEVNEKPDIILIGIPGGTLKMGQKFPNKCGILAYEIAQAVQPDVMILGILYQKGIDEKYLEELKTAHENRYGFRIDCINVSNTMYNSSYSEKLEKLQYIMINYKYVIKETKKIKSLKTPVFQAFESNMGRNVSQLLIDKLVEYAEDDRD